MNTIDSSQLLSQLRLAAAQAKNETTPVEQAQADSFSKLLTQSVDKVNELQQQSSKVKEAFEMGDSNVQLSEVMIASGKAGVAFQGMIQVRNKMLEAYQEIMRMQV